MRYCQKDILRKAASPYSRQMLLYGWKIEILNVKVQQRESRDLNQDLEDIQNGIRVTHASDQIKQVKEAKRQRKNDRREKREQKLAEKIIQNGWQSIPESM